MLSTSLAYDMNSTDSWINISSKINSYFSIVLFIFGIVGNVLNVLVLSQRSLRSNPCAWLFLMSSIFNLISILSGLTTRIIADWTYDITDTVGWLCKLRVFVLVASRTVASWLIMLATVDRWLLSCLNVDRRQMSSLKYAQRESIIIISLTIVLYAPILYCLDANLTSAPLKCYSRTIKCRIFVDQIYTCITTLLPLILMFSFSFLTMCNVRKLKQRLQSPLLLSRLNTIRRRSHEQRVRLKPIDRHLLIMLFVQISFLALFTLPQALQQIYSTMTLDVPKSSLQKSIENCFYRFAILLTYLASGMPFYIYTLCGGHVFRQAFFTLVRRLKEHAFCRK
jgi:hypothetical protein